jgi:hypothetical protein
MAGEHAREWLPIMGAVFLAERLLEGMATARDLPSVASADVRRLAELLTSVTVVIVPVMNPDGFRHTYYRAVGDGGELACGVGDATAGRCTRWGGYCMQLKASGLELLLLKCAFLVSQSCVLSNPTCAATSRLWRKSMSASPPISVTPTNFAPGADCRGVDLNRNWPVDWGFLRGGEHVSPDPCHAEYAGTVGVFNS